MPERAEHIPSPPPLDDQVDRLLADADANLQATDEAAGLDAMEFASPDDLLEQVNDSMQTLAAETDAAAAELVQAELAAQQPAADIATIEPPSPPAPDDHSGDSRASPQAPPAPADDFSSPETITRLDERLAANAQALSDAAPCTAAATTSNDAAPGPASEAIAADEVDDAEIQSQIAAEEAAHPARAPEPVAKPAPKASAPVPTPAPAPAMPARPAPTPAAAKAPSAAATATPDTAPAPAKPAMPAMPARQFHVGAIFAGVAAACVRPVASYTSRLSPTVRQTIGYAALVTIFQAACLWGFLIFRGPPADPAPASDPMVLRKVGDDAEHAARMKAAAAHAKPEPKPAAKPASPKHDSHGGH